MNWLASESESGSLETAGQRKRQLDDLLWLASASTSAERVGKGESIWDCGRGQAD